MEGGAAGQEPRVVARRARRPTPPDIIDLVGE